jgi:hypothetical protein
VPSAFVRNESVDVDAISVTDMRCPRDGCRSNNLTLLGTGQMDRVETLTNGQVTTATMDEATLAFEVEIIECPLCETRWHVKTREVAALERQNQTLRQIVIDGGGEDPYGVGRVN